VTVFGALLFLALSPVAFSVLYCLPHRYIELPSWREFFRQNRDLSQLAANPIMIAGLFAATWRSMIVGLAIGSFGENWRGKMEGIVRLAGFVGLLICAAWIARSPFKEVFLWGLTWAALGIAMFKTYSLILSCRNAVRWGWMSLKQCACLGVVSLVVFSAILGAVVLLVQNQALPIGLGAFAAAYFMSGAELPNCLIRLARDRHR